MKYLIVGGKQKIDAIQDSTHNTAEEGRVLLFDDETQSASLVIKHRTPDIYLPKEGTSITFKASSIRQNKLVACTQTEVLVYDLQNFELEFQFSHEYMNDVHHVDFVNDKYYVVSTGLDAILIFDKSGKLEDYISVAKGYDARERFGDIDFRKIPSTKPHKAHPNFISFAEDKNWVTRFHCDSLFELKDRFEYDQLGVKRMHDGHIYEGQGYYTSVDGNIIIINYDSKDYKKINLNSIDKALAPLGWCRGLCKNENNEYLVGFSRLRATKNIANIEWIKNFKRNVKSLASKPTRVACYDLDTETIKWAFNCEKFDLNLIYSILPLHEEVNYQ